MFSSDNVYSYFASGTGAAGLVGAFLWWEMRGLGVRVGVGLPSVSSSLRIFVLFLTFDLDHAINNSSCLLPPASS
jgi:hypothetical protein